MKLGGFVIAEELAPGLFEADDVRTLALGHFGHAVAEESIGEDQLPWSRLDKVGDRRFHSAAAGAEMTKVSVVRLPNTWRSMRWLSG